MRWLLLISITLIPDLILMGHKPQIEVLDGPYERIALTDSTRLEVYQYTDSTLVVMTACAPQCSSCARVYNKEGELIEQITPPLRSVFPLATMDKQTGRITWTDNDEWEY